jgi:hypothetical protein
MMKPESQKLIPKIAFALGNSWIALQRVRCGKPNCHCAGGGSFHSAYYLFTRLNRKLIKRYVRRDEVPALRREIARLRDIRRRSRMTKRDSILHWRRLREAVRSHELTTNTLKENLIDAQENHQN